MKKLILLITLLISTSCGNEQPLHTVAYENFEFYVKRMEVKESVSSNGWSHRLNIYWSIKNLEDERRIVPNVGLILLRGDLREDLRNFIYFPSTFELSRYGSYSHSLALSRNVLAANELTYEGNQGFTMSRNSNSKLEGVFTFIFLKEPHLSATTNYDFKSSHPDFKKKNFILEHQIGSYSFNIEDYYTF